MNRYKKLLLRAMVIGVLVLTSGCSGLGKAKVIISKTSDNTLKLSWSEVKDVEGYEIYSVLKQTGEHVYIGSTQGLEYTDVSMTPLSLDYFKVKAYKTGSTNKTFGPYSNSAQIISSKIIKPVLKVFSFTYTKVNLDWDPVSKATSYEVYYRKDNETSKGLGCVTTSATYCVIDGLTPNTSYAFSIRTVIETEGTYSTSEFTQDVIAKTSDLSDPMITVTASRTTLGVFIFPLDMPKGDGYEVYVSTSPTITGARKVSDSAVLFAAVSGLKTTTTYYVMARAYVNTPSGRRYNALVPTPSIIKTLK